MQKIKLVNGMIINVTSVELVHGVLRITTAEETAEKLTVEELADIFSDKSNTSLITLLTESGAESGYKTGFTSFAGIIYDAEGNKTVELFQPVDATEARISNAEGAANVANDTAKSASATATEVMEQNVVLAATVDSILTDVIPNLMV